LQLQAFGFWCIRQIRNDRRKSPLAQGAQRNSMSAIVPFSALNRKPALSTEQENNKDHNRSQVEWQ
jgi:hypothetical protein